MPRILTIALTGGIGSGKSTVAHLFAELGAPVIDSDIIARQVVAPGTPLLQRIVDEHGKQILDDAGALDRKKLSDIVFNQPEQRKKLENMLHPVIYQEIDRQIACLNFPYCIVVIPLLVETGATAKFDRILVVDVPEKLQVSRTMDRDNIQPELVEKIIDAQVDRNKRLAHADDVINNNVTIKSLKQSVNELHDKYLQLARHQPDFNLND